MNFSVLEALFSNRANYAIVDAGARRETGYAELGNNTRRPCLRSRSSLICSPSAERRRRNLPA